MSMKKLGAGWTKKGKSEKGQEYINVKITQDIPAGSFIQIFANNQKMFATQPDYNVVCYIHTEEAIAK